MKQPIVQRDDETRAAVLQSKPLPGWRCPFCRRGYVQPVVGAVCTSTDKRGCVRPVSTVVSLTQLT